MQSKAKPATKAEKDRFEKIVALGCCACHSDGHLSIHPVEAHHLLDGGVRRGHRFSVALCSWHHRGAVPEGFNVSSATERFGPSLYHDGRSFRSKYGNDDALLSYQEFLLTL